MGAARVPDPVDVSEDSCTAALPILVSGARQLETSLSDRQRVQFVRYCDVLRKANRTLNLTALRTPEQIMSDLFLDSLTLVLALPDGLKAAGSRCNLVDMGAGAGVPGIPLRILFPAWDLTLIESIGKKARFLEEVCSALQLTNVRVVSERAEIAGATPPLRDGAGLCVARAVAALPTLVELCAPLTKPGGLLIFPKSGEINAEIEAAEPAARALCVETERTVSVPSDLHGRDSGKRCLVVYRKIDRTPPGYPRRVGLAKSRPIGRELRRPV